MKMKKIVKSAMAGVVTVAILLSGIVISPMREAEAVALPTDGDKVVYDDKTGSEFKSLYGESKIAPTKEGYLFGGWYRDQGTTAIKEGDELNDITDTSTVYAKFVPAYVLSIKSQNYSTTAASADGNASEDNKTTTRVVSTVDASLLYQEIGFDLVFNNKEVSKSSTKVWEKLAVDGTDYSPETIFGTVSEYFFVLNINNIPETKWADCIWARPYWVTEDGTRVEGLGKYVYVEDGVKGYISVPVNLNDVTTGVAAGVLNVDYDETKMEFLECVSGRIFSEMKTAEKITTDGNQYIRCAGAVDELEDVNKDDMYITLRFKVTADETLTSRSKPYQFTISGEDFTNISEDDVELTVWDVQF